MAADALAAYLDHNHWFYVFTDSSDYQLGACIVQNAQPVAYFSHKLSKLQQNYMEMENKMLSIVAMLNMFQSMLLGSDIYVFMHQVLTWEKYLMWCIYIIFLVLYSSDSVVILMANDLVYDMLLVFFHELKINQVSNSVKSVYWVWDNHMNVT